MRNKTRDILLGAGGGGILLGTLLFAISPGDIVDDIVKSASQGVQDSITAAGNAIGQLGSVILNSFAIGPVQSIGNGLASAIDIVFAPIDTLSGLFGDLGSALGPSSTGALTAAAGGDIVVLGSVKIPGLTVAIFGVFTIGAGIAIINVTDYPLPVIGDVGEGVGAPLIIVGSMFGLYGFYPEISKIIFALTFGATFLAAGFVFYNIVRAVEDTESGIEEQTE